MLTQNEILQAIPNVLTDVNLVGFDEKISGKVRDIYTRGDQRVLITTDRISAFDRVLGAIPFKGQVSRSHRTGTAARQRSTSDADYHAWIVRLR